MKPAITFIVPALNEEENILLVIDSAMAALERSQIIGEIVVINDGSTDKTSLLVEEKIKQFPETIKMIIHPFSQGIGASFWDGVEEALGDIVVMLPGDNENDPNEILRYYSLMEQVDIVVPFIFNKEMRPFFRRLLAALYHFIIKVSFSFDLRYTNGTTLYRRSLLQELSHRSFGFFFQTDILVRLVKKGYLFAEVPHKLSPRHSGSSKAMKLSSLVCLMKEYLYLFGDYYFKKKQLFKGEYAADSITRIRKKEK
jgi:glycosyltransferase involved in cell wall biosynthesis